MDQWHVRDENGGVFGPVVFSTLKSWVEDGRVSPASEVSRIDGQWELAVKVAELKMNCVAEIEPASFYGPIHRKAMQGLIESGSIPAEARIYCMQCEQEQRAPLPAEAGVSQAKYDTALAQLAAMKAEKSAGEAELRCVRAELAELSVSLQSECERTIELSETTAKLQQELQAQSTKLTTSHRKSDKMLRTQQAEIADLNGSIIDLQLKVEALGLERENFSAEIEALRRDNQELRKKLEQCEQRHQAELREQSKQCEQRHQAELSERESAHALQISTLKRECEREVREKESAYALQVSALTCEHEREVSERESAHALQISTLKRECEREVHEKESAYALQVSALTCEHEREVSERESAHTLQISTLKRECEREVSEKESAYALEINALALEREREVEAMAAKNLQLTGLLQRLEELELANQGLKEEFIKHEGLKNNSGSSDGIAQRKLILVKGLFAEAAKVLEGVEACVKESATEIQDAAFADGAVGELLEYEEVSVEELKVRKVAPKVASTHTTENRGQPVSVPVTESRDQPVPEQNNTPNKPKAGKKWPFGSTDKRLNHGSLAELEAQAQIELQRLASSQDISSLFDRKK